METGFGNSELGQKAKAFFEANVAHQLTPDDHGKYLVIDVDTDQYEMDQDIYQAGKRAHDRNPTGKNRFIARIGHKNGGYWLRMKKAHD